MDIPKLVKEEVENIDPQAEVILFGSRAREDFEPDSDWDFLILLDSSKFSKKTKNKLRDKLYTLELQTNSVISSIIHSKQEWKKRSVTPLYQIIEEEGTVA